MTKYQQAVEFFKANAGFSYVPGTETKAQGKLRCARELAKAEKRHNEFDIEWFVDKTSDSSDFSDERPSWPSWVCLIRNAKHEVVASCCGIDFGSESPDPWGKPYKRVVEAELIAEALGN